MAVNADLGKGKIVVSFDYDRSRVAAIKGIPGAKFVPKEKGGPHWTVPLDLDTAKQLRATFTDQLRITADLKRWGRRAVDQHSALEGLSGATDAELEVLHHEAPEMASTLRPFQRSAIKFAAVSDHPLIADQPGLGKTREAIGGVLESGLSGPYLVIAPKTSLRTVWEDHLNDVLDRDDAVFTIVGGRKQRLALLAEAEAAIEAGRNTWVIVNPEMVRFRGDAPAFPLLHDITWSAVIIDECHRGAVRNPKTQTARALYKLSAEKRIALSGTPMKNRPLDLWGTLHWLDPQRFSSKWRWAQRWLHTYHNGYGTVFCTGRNESGGKCGECEGGIRVELMDAFAEHLKPFVLRRTKAEVYPELPPKQHVDVMCEMDPEQAAQYNDFAALAEVVIQDETVSATNVLAELTRLKQFAISKQLVSENQELGTIKLTPDIGHSGKRDALEQLLEERDIFTDEPQEKVVIFSQFGEVTMALYNWLTNRGVECRRIMGDVKAADRDTAQREFQAEGGPTVMLMTTTAGGTAITLDRADTVIFMDETWSPADMEQAEDRVHRVSRIHNVTVYTLRTAGTVDQYIAEIVDEKGSIHRAVLDDRRKVQLR